MLKKYEKMFARIGGKWKRSEEQKMRTDSENLKKTKYFIFDFFEEQSKRPFTKPVKFNFWTVKAFFVNPKNGMKN